MMTGPADSLALQQQLQKQQLVRAKDAKGREEQQKKSIVVAVLRVSSRPFASFARTYGVAATHRPPEISLPSF